ncbi:MAG: response regulator [Alphaproteobacteria bacterium]|nr:response regulator [Alphaproteobacteria bacterium]
MDDPDSVRHLLVVDDDRRIRELLQKYLIEHGYRVTTASDAQEARKRMTRFDFDLLIVDIMMPGEDGLTLTKQLRTKTDVPILVLTARGEPEDRIAGFESGADDYLAKPFEPRELLLRVASILRRVSGPLPTLTGLSLGRFYFDLKRNELRDGNKAVRLTSAETGLLKIFSVKPGQIISRYDLCDRLGVSDRTVDVQVTRLRRKIEDDPKTPRYLQTVWGEGYVLRPD